MYVLLTEYQKARPDVTFEALVQGSTGWGPQENDARYATGALFVEAVHRRTGIAGLRALVGTPSELDSLLVAVRKHLGLSLTDPKALDGWWREAAPATAQEH
jgi:hypothetical protein